MPRTGVLAFVLTAGLTALLFSFRTPDEMFGGGVANDFGQVVATAQLAEPPRTASAAGSGSSAGDPGANGVVTAPPTPVPTDAPATATAQAQTPQTIKGQVVRTPYGDIQVEVTVAGSTIHDVTALQLPFDRSYSRRISQVVEPMLRQEVLQAQSARIDLISGATYTSKGYAMSLQSALDRVA